MTKVRYLHVVVLATVVALVPARDALGWRMREHRAIGAESYIAACNRLTPLKDRDPQTAVRYDIACGNLNVQSFLYGQGTSVGGDFLADSDEFRSTFGAALAVDRGNYLRLALRNSTHFHPMVTREWGDLHEVAIAGALAASQKQGVALVDSFEQVFYDSAFADHFLQDSFAAGHMGFNRPASSAGAAHAYHDEWNKRGRMVSNRRGAVWKTFGDNLLDIKENAESRKHVIAAATDSVYSVLAAFVLGEYDGTSDLAVWNEVPFTIEDPELFPSLFRLFAGTQKLTRPELLPLLAVKRPAVKDQILGIWTSYSFPFDSWGHPSGVVVFGGNLIIPGLGLRMEAGVGFGFEGSFTEPRFAVDAGLVRGLGITVDGLFSHELDLGSLLLIDGDVDATLRLSLRTNLEAGDQLLRVDVGPSYNVNADQFGLYVGLGYARVLSAAGGGFF
ncbi:MAG TPA: hypothetical protein VFV99_22400 [Kofleriaceae bacterium]|nr:hypothetical protein [Kofleriaceae bacterium]